MAYRARNALVKEAYDKIRTIATLIKSQAQRISAELNSDISRERVWQYGFALEQNRAEIVAFESLDMVAWAKEQEGDPSYDAAAEYQAMKSAINAVLVAIRSAMPVNANGYVALQQFASKNSLELTPGILTPAQTAGLKALVDALDNAIV